MKRPDNCLECGVAIKPAPRFGSLPQGVRRHAAKGLCVPCYDRDKKPGPKGLRTKRATNCLQCNHPLRPSRTKLADHPGTRCHQGKGLCSGCYRKPDAPKPDTPHAKPITPEQLDYYRAGLHTYLTNRRRRIQQQTRLQLLKAAN
jgi:hypothetical protein